jgi:hypothetical protein
MSLVPCQAHRMLKELQGGHVAVLEYVMPTCMPASCRLRIVMLFYMRMIYVEVHTDAGL